MVMNLYIVTTPNLQSEIVTTIYLQRTEVCTENMNERIMNEHLNNSHFPDNPNYIMKLAVRERKMQLKE